MSWLEREVPQMVSSGVESVRFGIYQAASVQRRMGSVRAVLLSVAVLMAALERAPRRPAQLGHIRACKAAACMRELTFDSGPKRLRSQPGLVAGVGTRREMKRLPTIASVLLAGLLALPVATARGRVPSGFVGTVANGPLVLLSAPKISREFDVMATSGVESVKTDFFWATAQPYQSFDEVSPSQRSRYESVDGVPTDFSAMDRLVRLAAARRISLLPVVSVAPAWAAQEPGNPNSPPSDDASYARFVAALARRYGPRGSFWSATGPEVPIRSWQIWNEPNSWLSHYALLLRAVRPALKLADPGAQLVAGALTNTSYSLSWNALESIYAAGGRGQFDAVAINPYTFDINGVVENARLIRRVMSNNGDSRLPLLITEMSWPSALRRTSSQPDWVVTPTGEAQRVSQAYRVLASQRTRLKLQAAYWYTWMTLDNQGVDAFGYAGLRRLDRHGNVVSKPAYVAFKQVALALEGCRSKGPAATSCRP